MVLKDRSLNSSHQQSLLSPKALERALSCLFQFLVFCKVLVSPGHTVAYRYITYFCLFLPMTMFLLYIFACMAKLPSFGDDVYLIRTHFNPVWFHPNLILCKQFQIRQFSQVPGRQEFLEDIVQCSAYSYFRVMEPWETMLQGTQELFLKREMTFSSWIFVRKRQ